MKRHIKAYRNRTKLCLPYQRDAIAAVYTDADRELLAEVDNATGRLSGNNSSQSFLKSIRTLIFYHKCHERFTNRPQYFRFAQREAMETHQTSSEFSSSSL